KDEYSQIGFLGNDAAQKQHDRARFADARSADDSKMPGNKVVDRNMSRNSCVLCQRADGNAALSGLSINGSEIGGADTVSNSARMGELGNATIECGLPIRLYANLTQKLDMNMERIVASAYPHIARHKHVANEADDAIVASSSGYQLADGPIIVGCGGRRARQCRYDGAFAIALDDVTFRAIALHVFAVFSCAGIAADFAHAARSPQLSTGGFASG